MIPIKLYLTDLPNFIHKVKSKKTGLEVECISFPIDLCNFYRHEKGSISIDMCAFPLKEKREDQSHIIVQSLPEELREKMKAENKDNPIIGNLNIHFSTENKPKGSMKSDGLDIPPPPEDDLPF